MKRFYTLVSHDKTQGGYSINLDGKAVKTQSGALLIAPNRSIADMVVQEWSAQVDHIDPETMPVTQILNTKIDQVAHNREKMSAAVMRYVDTDLLCYITEEPEELLLLQNQEWGRWRSWLEGEYDLTLEITSGLASLQQPKALHEQLQRFIDGLNDDEFTVMQILVPLSGSMILSLAMLNKQATSADLLTACFLEEDFKNTLYDADKYGEDPHIEARKKNALRDLEACEKYLASF